MQIRGKLRLSLRHAKKKKNRIMSLADKQERGGLTTTTRGVQKGSGDDESEGIPVNFAHVETKSRQWS